MAREADPLRAASRWRPRPARLRCLRPSGEVEIYAVADGRRAWSTLRRNVPNDIIEVVGEDAAGAIVGRWESSSAAAAIAAVAAGAGAGEPDDDPPPNEDAANFRFLLREVRQLFADQLRANREVLAVVTDALRVQRDTFASVAGRARPAAAAAADDDDDDDDETFGKLTSLLGGALRLVQAERAPHVPVPEVTTPIAPPRETHA